MTKSSKKSQTKYLAGRACGSSDLTRNGREWYARNLAALVRLGTDNADWLRGYAAAQ